VFDNFSTGSRENLAAVASTIEVIEGDLRDAEAVRHATEGSEIVYHLAAEASVPRSVVDPRTCYDVNVGGTLNVLLAARDCGCRRVVFSSSCAVYGDGPPTSKSESLQPAPTSPYASSKLAGEELCRVFTRAYDLDTVALRYFNVYGPGQNPHSPYAAVVPRFINALLRAEPITVYGDGEQTRDFIYVDDVVAGNVLAAKAPGVAGKAFNVASGTSVSINTLLAKLTELLRVEAHVTKEPARGHEIRHSAASVRAAVKRLGFSASVDISDGLALTLLAATQASTGAPASR
jgi:UDP-glucose 4-epimerase